MPGCLPAPPAARRLVDLRPDDDFPREDVDRAELRGDLAADVRAVFGAVVFEVLFDLLLVEPVRPDLAVRELPLFPLDAVFDRADVVPRDEDDLELPDLVELLLEPPRDGELLLLLLLLRPDEAFLAAPVPELFLVVDELPVDRLLADFALLFEPVALFFVVLRDEPPDERELDADFFDVDVREPPLEERVPEDLFAPLLADLELDPDDLFEPADEDRDDEVLFLAAPLLAELEDEREPLDFLVVAILSIPPKFFGLILHGARVSKIRALFYLYQVETSHRQLIGRDDH